ncbi:MAG: helix-hairpin-helix domain-containing protein [Chthoniobacterales bacterium]
MRQNRARIRAIDLVLFREVRGRFLNLAPLRIALVALLLLARPTRAGEAWAEWKDCRLEENDSNDGDSFHVKAGRREYIVRLYFVDAPETDAGFPERVAEQGKYFGLTPAQAVQLGELAKKFADEKLARPFTVHTRKQNAMGRSNAPRFYGMVETSEGDLGELLVANGLARVHGVGANPPGMTDSADEKRKLAGLEQNARLHRLGGWGAAAGGMGLRLATPAANKPQDSFDAFFHPERPKTAPVSAAVARPTIATPPRAVVSAPVPEKTEGKLDVNTATLTELDKLPGIGPVLAGRILAARPFKSAEELRRVQGIGKKKYEKLRPYFSR